MSVVRVVLKKTLKEAPPVHFLRCLLLLFILLFLLFSKGFSQRDQLLSTRRYDSLSHILKRQTGDSAAFTLLQISDYWARLNNGSDSLSVFPAQKAYSIFKGSGNGFGMSWAKFEEGSAQLAMGNLEQAVKLLTAAKDIPINDTVKRKNELLGTIWNQIATVYDRKGNFEQSIDIALKQALPYFEKSKNESRISSIYSGIASTFLNLNQYQKAVLYYKKELLDLQAEKKEMSFATDFSRLGYCLTKLHKLDEARPYFDSALNVLKGSPLSYPWLKYHYFKGYWEKTSDHYQAALFDYDAALNIGQKINDSASMVNVLYAKYDLLYTQKDYGRARDIAYSIKTITQALKDTIALDRLSLYKTLWESEKSVGNFKMSLNWLEQYSQLSDTLHQRDQVVKINDLLDKYQTEKKEKEILQLETTTKQQLLTLESSKFTTLLLTAGLIIALLLLLGTFSVLSNRKKLSRQKDLVHEQQLRQKESEQQLLLSNAMLEGVEKERARLSHDLHDGLGGILFGIKLKLQSLNESLTEKKGELGNLVSQLSEAVSELRRIAHNMMPENLQRFGLEVALQDLCNAMQTPGTAIHFYSMDLYKDLPKHEQLIIYRIIQELLANALKHAGASEIIVECIQQGDRISLTVEDDGQGFDLAKNTQGIGLQNIQNRTKFLHGDLTVDSKKNIGTSFHIQLLVTTARADWQPYFEEINLSEWQQN